MKKINTKKIILVSDLTNKFKPIIRVKCRDLNECLYLLRILYKFTKAEIKNAAHGSIRGQYLVQVCDWESGMILWKIK